MVLVNKNSHLSMSIPKDNQIGTQHTIEKVLIISLTMDSSMVLSEKKIILTPLLPTERGFFFIPV
jgi:hypothetical protein